MRTSSPDLTAGVLGEYCFCGEEAMDALTRCDEHPTLGDVLRMKLLHDPRAPFLWANPARAGAAPPSAVDPMSGTRRRTQAAAKPPGGAGGELANRKEVKRRCGSRVARSVTRGWLVVAAPSPVLALVDEVDGGFGEHAAGSVGTACHCQPPTQELSTGGDTELPCL